MVLLIIKVIWIQKLSAVAESFSLIEYYLISCSKVLNVSVSKKS